MIGKVIGFSASDPYVSEDRSVDDEFTKIPTFKHG
jgi:hypothetical protein